MKHFFLLIFTSIILFQNMAAQDSSFNQHDSIIEPKKDPKVNTDFTSTVKNMYHISFKIDAPITAVGLGLAFLGDQIIRNKKPLTQAELATKSINDIPFFDRGNAGYYSDQLNKDSYIPMLGSFPLPIVMTILNKNERHSMLKIWVLYLETEAITGAMYSMTNGLINRPRPLVYGVNTPTDQRLNKNNQRSFYAGHTASSASATFFGAKIFSDMNPDSKAKVYVWTVAAIIPAVVGYLRYQSGFHFLSDNVLGYTLGALTGILVPQFHKSKLSKKLSISPLLSTSQSTGIAFSYKFN